MHCKMFRTYHKESDLTQEIFCKTIYMIYIFPHNKLSNHDARITPAINVIIIVFLYASSNDEPYFYTLKL